MTKIIAFTKKSSFGGLPWMLLVLLLAGSGCRAFREMFDEPPRKDKVSHTAPAPSGAPAPQPRTTTRKPASMLASELSPREQEILRAQLKDNAIPEKTREEQEQLGKQNRNWVFGF